MSDQGDSQTSRLGGIVGPRLARLMADATVSARAQMAPHMAATAQKVLADFTNHVSDELRAELGPLWSQVANDPATHDVVRAVATKLATERGQAWMWLAGTATSIGLGSGFGNFFTNALTPSLGAAIAATPNIRLSPSDAAAAELRGISWGADLALEAANSGINRDRFQTLMALQSLTLSPNDVMELLNRGLMTPEGARQAFRRMGYLHDHSDFFFKLRQKLPSTADVAAMWNRGIIDTETANTMAARDGTHPDDMARYLLLGGEPPPLTDLFLAWRRGVITEADVDRAIRQGPVRFEWIDALKELRWVPLAPQEAADAVNQGHMPLEEARRIAEESGVRPRDFDTIIANAGLPPGLEVATEALNRGLIDETAFERMFLESRLKNIYAPLYRDLRWRVIPQETVRKLYREGVYTREQAAERLGWAGYSPVDREALLASEDTGSTESTKDLSKAEILALFTDRAIDEATAREFLAALGYGAGEVEWLITLAEIRRSRRYVDAVITRVRAGYVNHRMDANEASSIMDGLSVPPEQRDELLGLWDLERLAVTAGLTLAQLQAALKRNMISRDEFTRRLIERGYSADDAQILLLLSTPVPK